jgi:acyl carrier protein
MAHLQRYLPDYMLPSAFMPMKAFPLTVNGKLDRAALPHHTFQIDEQTYLAPRTALEETLANIWAEALNLDSVGVEDHFFHLGGHSLSAARIVATIKQKLGKHLLLADFYRAGTIANLIHCLDDIQEPNQQHTQPALEQHSKGKLPLDDFQLMLWLSHLFEPKAKKMNIIVRKRLHGVLNVPALQQAFQDTFAQQDALHYRIARLFPTQFKQNKLPFEITQERVNHLSEKACESFLLKSVDALTNVYPWPRHYPLVLARIFHLPNDVVELQLCMPHLIADEMSLQILCNDLSRHYLNHTQQRQDTVSLHPFKDYISHEQRANNTNLEPKITFWEKHLHDAQLFVFPKHHVVDNMDKQKLSYSTYTEIPAASLTYLRHFCAENHVNVNDTLSAALATALKECCPGHDYESHPMLINLIKSTRENPDYDHTIGCFVRVDPLKIDLRHQPNMSSLSKQIHRTVIDTAPQQQCSTLLKFACLTKCFHKKALVKSWFTRFGMFIYTKLLRQLKLSFDQDTVFNMCWRLAAFNRKHYFIVNLNLWNNFLTDQDQTHGLFGLKSAPIPMHPYELLTIDYTLDVCFLRDESSQKPYVVISSNLTPEFRERLAAKIIALISKPTK